MWFTEKKKSGKFPVRFYNLKWDTTIFNPQVRKFVNESSTTFSAAQKLQFDDKKSNLKELLKLSHQYRSIISACIDDLNQAADDTEGEEAKELQELGEIYYKTELVWHLCEILYLERPTGVLPHLLEWIRIHFPMAGELAREVLKSPNPYLHGDYWSAIYGLLFQLQIEQALKLLGTHPDFLNDSFQSARELLKKIPIYGVSILFTATIFSDCI